MIMFASEMCGRDKHEFAPTFAPVLCMHVVIISAYLYGLL